MKDISYLAPSSHLCYNKIMSVFYHSINNKKNSKLLRLLCSRGCNLYIDGSCGLCFQVQTTFFGHIPDSVAVAQYNTILRLCKMQKQIYFSSSSLHQITQFFYLQKLHPARQRCKCYIHSFADRVQIQERVIDLKNENKFLSKEI